MSDSGIRDLVFELEYKFPLTRVFSVLAGRLAETKPAWWGEAWFYWVLGAAYLVLLGLMFHSVLKGGNLRS
jgi:hypothetical protein